MKSTASEPGLSGVCESHSSDNCLQTQNNRLRVFNKRFLELTSRDQCNAYRMIGNKSFNLRQNDEVQLTIKGV